MSLLCSCTCFMINFQTCTLFVRVKNPKQCNTVAFDRLNELRSLLIKFLMCHLKQSNSHIFAHGCFASMLAVFAALYLAKQFYTDDCSFDR